MKRESDSADTAGPTGIASVVGAWLGSRLIVLGAGVDASHTIAKSLGAILAGWDGGWYRNIALNGYELTRSDAQTAYPFFPLLPAILRSAEWLGLPMIVSGLLLNSSLFLLGLLGLWLLVRDWSDAPTATMAVWAAALLPGSQAYSMIYPEALFFSASVWAFYLARDVETAATGSPVDTAIGAGILGAVATLARPNGILMPTSLALGAILAGRTSPQRLASYLMPASLALGGWMLYLWNATGDPFVWIRAKSAWNEITLLSWVESGGTQISLVDVAPLPIAVGALWWTWRRLPISWRVFVATWLALPLLTGTVGWPRYTASCFPVAATLGAVLAPLPPWLQRGGIALSALYLAWYSYRVLGMWNCP